MIGLLRNGFCNDSHVEFHYYVLTIFSDADYKEEDDFGGDDDYELQTRDRPGAFGVGSTLEILRATTFHNCRWQSSAMLAD